MSVGLAVLAMANSASAAAAIPAPGWEPRDYLALVSALGTIVALVVSYVVSTRTLNASYATTEAGIWQKANEVELRSIEAKLDGFFGPYMELSGSLNTHLKD